MHCLRSLVGFDQRIQEQAKVNLKHDRCQMILRRAMRDCRTPHLLVYQRPIPVWSRDAGSFRSAGAEPNTWLLETESMLVMKMAGLPELWVDFLAIGQSPTSGGLFGFDQLSPQGAGGALHVPGPNRPSLAQRTSCWMLSRIPGRSAQTQPSPS